MIQKFQNANKIKPEDSEGKYILGYFGTKQDYFRVEKIDKTLEKGYLSLEGTMFCKGRVFYYYIRIKKDSYVWVADLIPDGLLRIDIRHRI